MTHNRDAGTLGDMEDRIQKAEIFMPSGYDEIRLYKAPTKRMWTYVRMLERYKDQSSSDVFIYDEDGELIAEICGFKETLVGSVEGNAESASGLLYEYEWKLEASPSVAEKRFEMPKLDEICRQLKPSEVSESAMALLQREAEFKSQLQPICSGLIAESFVKLGLNEIKLPCKDLDQLVDRLGIPDHRSDLAKHLLEGLIEDSILSNVDGKFTVAAIENQANPNEQLRKLFWSWPDAYRRLSLIAQSAIELPSVLRGEVDPLDGGAFGNLNEVEDNLWASSPAAKTEFDQTAEFLKQLLAGVRPGRPARILDLKGGSGRLAGRIIEEVPNDLVEYVFCDSSDEDFDSIGEAFAKGTQNRQLKFQVIDLSAETLVAEDETLPMSEVIIAHEGLGDQKDLPALLSKLKNQLVPGGVLLMIEPLSRDRSRDLTFGLHSHNMESNPSKSVEQWCDSLKVAGFESSQAIPTNSKISSFLRSVVVAQRSIDDEVEELPELEEQSTDSQQVDTDELWLVFADQSGHAEKMAALISSQGNTPVLVEAGETFGKSADNRYTINPSELDDYQKLLKVLGPKRPEQILYFWSQDTPPLDRNDNSLATSQTYGALAPVLFCQAWTQVCSATPTGLWLITKNAQAISGDSVPVALGQTPLWGTGRVVMFEFPHLKCKLVDLGLANEAELQLLHTEILTDSIEDELALRDDARYVHRFEASSLSKHADRGEQSGEPYRLHLSDYGTLDGMRLRPAELREPLDLPTLVEVEVHAAALNFSDVIKALGLYPGLPEGFVPVGIECAGVITKVGDEVTDFKPGDEVVCITPMAISSHTYTDQRFVAHKPKHLSMSAAATLPIAFLTAHYALDYIGRMEKDEKVLVNAATGGVGLAAIQLAQAAGGELFATAGTDEKRALLDFLGIEHIMNSRTLAFADEVLEKTDHRGVDLILNSLSGEAIGKGMSILAPYGRFLEIGKRDIYGNTPLGLKAFRNNVTLAAIDLDRGLREKPDLCSKMFREIIADADAKKIAALPHRVFPITQLVDAFRYMAKAKHIGKVILEIKDHAVRPVRDPNAAEIKFKADASYIVTGGLGGLGSELAPWMADQGARCLVLVSRRGVCTEEGEQLVQSLEERGVKVVIEKVDLSKPDDVDAMVKRIQATLPPLRGIMHGAVVLDDGLILHMDEERIERVCAPKMNAAWYLHEATLGIDLDFFVSHSSTSSTMGNAGQANYAAANAFLDGLAQYRRSIGLPALTVNWGYLGDLGVAAANKKLAEKFEQQGIRPVSTSEGLPILGKLMSFSIEQMAVMRVDWLRLKQIAPMLTQSPRFGQMMQATTTSDDANGQSGNAIRNLILATDPEERNEVMLEIARERVARILGTRPEKIEVDRSLMDMGLDSLMGFELRNWIEGELRINIPVVELMQGPTVEKLTALILAQLEKAENPDAESGDVNSDLLSEHLALLNADPEQTKILLELVSMSDDVRTELQTSDESINLADEASLPADMFGAEFAQSLISHRDACKTVEQVFMTGATGFLGAYVLHNLLEANSTLEICCLVRADSEQHGLSRIHQNLEKYELWNPAFAERVQVVLGDVTQPKFGLDSETYDRLAESVDLLLHNAAGVNFMQGYSQLKPINVGGTENALRFACHRKIKAYHHVSTLFTFSILDHMQQSVVKESHNPARHELLFGGYLQSKWVADNLVQQARDLGLPVTIYRPGIVTGDSRSGMSSDDIISRTLASAIQLGCTPTDNTQFPFTPVDYVGEAIAKLALTPESVNRNYHLVNRDLVDWPTLIGWLADVGYKIDILPYEDWLQKLKQSSAESAGTMLSALLPLIPELQLSGEAERLDPPTFDCSQSEEALAAQGVQCPEISRELITTYARFLAQEDASSPDSDKKMADVKASERSQ